MRRLKNVRTHMNESSTSQVLLIGPAPPPVNGQSLCFGIVIDAIEQGRVVNRNVDQFNSAKKLLVFAKAFVSSIRYLLIGKVDVIYISVSRSWPGTIFDSIIILIGKMLGKRVILHLHGNDFLTYSVKRSLFGWVYSKVDCFIALSEPMKLYLENVVTCPVKVILNPVQDFFFQNQPIKPKDSKIRIVYLSNIMQSKGIFDFLSLAIVCSNSEFNNKFEFHVIGKLQGDPHLSAENTRANFNKQISKLTNTTYHGPVYGKPLSRVLGEMDILLFPSYYPVEALPLSVLEAASQALYVIVNKHNDLPVFATLLPSVHVANTSDSSGLLEHLESLSKKEFNELGKLNMSKSRSFSVANHVKQVKEILY